VRVISIVVITFSMAVCGCVSKQGSAASTGAGNSDNDDLSEPNFPSGDIVSDGSLGDSGGDGSAPEEAGSTDASAPDVAPSDSSVEDTNEALVCDEGKADCDGDKANGCEVDLLTSSKHCGHCGNSCSVENGTASCDAGKCIIVCGDGWTGENCKDDIDECADGTNNCDEVAACSNTPGSFKCTCPLGSEGDGTTCTPLDECALGTAECDENADCINTEAGYDCECKSGFVGTGKQCADLDECLSATSDCDENATCTNTSGGFECECSDGYSGDGKVCIKDPSVAGECKAAFFSGNNCILVPDIFAEPMTEFTIEFWLRVDDYDYLPNYATIIDQFAGTTLAEPGLRLSFLKTGTWSKKIHYQETSIGGGAQGQFFYEDFPVTVWKHVAFVRTPNANGGAKSCQFINGVQKQCAYMSKANDAPSNLEIMRIGCENANVNITNYVKGAMDELRISNVARYKEPFEPQQQLNTDDATVLLLHFDGELVDESGNNFTPVWEGEGAFTEAPPELECPL